MCTVLVLYSYTDDITKLKYFSTMFYIKILRDKQKLCVEAVRESNNELFLTLSLLPSRRCCATGGFGITRINTSPYPESN